MDTELRTYATFLAHGLRHPRLLAGNATQTQRARPMPGDDLVTAPGWTSDFVVEIGATAETTWPWLCELLPRGAWTVARLVPYQALVLLSESDEALYAACSWAFLLDPIDAKRTRLHVRVRARPQPSQRRRLAQWVARIADNVFEHEMLERLRDRIETSGAAPTVLS